MLEAGFATRLSIYGDFKSITPYSIGNVQNNIAYSFAFKVFSGNSSSSNFNTNVDLSSSMPWISVESASATSVNLKLGYSAVVPAPPGKNQDYFYTVRLIVTQSDGKSINADVRLSHLAKISPEIINEYQLNLGTYNVGTKLSLQIKKS